MNRQLTAPRFDELVKLGASGRQQDVDRLMKALEANDDLATISLVDLALGLVDKREGLQRVRDYLFQGSQIQRDYAALYFKRRGITHLLDQAAALGRIDREQASSK